MHRVRQAHSALQGPPQEPQLRQAPEDLFGRHSLLAATGLLQPPIFELSAALSARHPDRVPAATLSVPSLVASLVA